MKHNQWPKDFASCFGLFKLQKWSQIMAEEEEKFRRIWPNDNFGLKITGGGR